uniref:NADH-ubiquinone oxidoreductase chain 1 n=1 Tax=Salminus brasiliensis TaxID=930266 RepID=A0A0U1V6C1_SALBR|nr:NADH dehydrogenase subunit 1 [Salminus brasiliensis]AIN79165.1 NADH dehydrogenase subunit 1 [Salminus brasiliensis]
MLDVLIYLIHPIILIVFILLAVAFLTLVERKVLGYMQLRKGPNIVGPYGILQPIADGVKLFLKEPVRPSTSSPFLFLATPVLALTLALTLWAPMPTPHPFTNLNLGILFIMALSSLTVYSTLGSGWASNSKYALIGALRAVAQAISYEVSLGLILLATIVMAGSFSLPLFSMAQESTWLFLPAWPLMMMWFVTTLAETNRAPFDLTEGESELVSGFNVEYAAGPFALFFLAEYATILFMNALTTILFFGTSNNQLAPELTSINLLVKTTLLTTLFLWVRASYPRFRYDQLMHLVWKNFLPLALAFVLWYIALPLSLISIPPQLI